MDRVSETKTSRASDYNQFSSDVESPTISIDDLLPKDRESKERTEFQLRQSLRQLEQISAAAQVFSLELDLRRLYAVITTHACEILRADRVVFYSNIDNQLVAESQSPNVQSETYAAADNVRWCVKYLKPKLDNSPTEDVRNSICVPLVGTQNRVLGVIEARNKKTGGSFTEHDERVAVCLARVACSSVDRGNLFYRIEEWRESIETLLSFNATVNQQLEPSEMVSQLVANVTGFLDADGGAAGIVVRQDSQVFAVSDSFYYDGKTHDYPRRWKTNVGIPGTVIETEFPLLINDYDQHELADPELVEKFDIGSCICVSIKNSKEEVLGFFKLHRRIGEPEFTWQDAAFLESLGNTAAVAIENARLVRSLEIKNDQIKNLSQDHVRRLEEERQHIARELHDQTGQVLVGLKLRLQVLSGMLNDEQAGAKEELAGLRTQLNQAASQLKDMAKRLRPPTLDELGFEASLRQLVSEYRRQVDFSIKVQIQTQPILSKEAETALFRIAQECLTNIAKHSNASAVEISYSEEKQKQVFRIFDNGEGFESNNTTNGLGLIGIKERVKMLDGTFSIESNQKAGTKIKIKLPKVSQQ